MKEQEVFMSIITYATKKGSVLMGDDFIGFKFVGDNAKLLNYLLSQNCPKEIYLTEKLLKEKNITVVPYDFDIWKEN